MPRPSKRLIQLAFLWLLLGLLASFSPAVWAGLWAWGGGLALLFLTVDALALPRGDFLRCEREIPARFALGEADEVELQLTLTRRARLEIEVFDELPPDSECEVFPYALRLRQGEQARFRYPLRLMRRGEQNFGRTQVRYLSPMGFWSRQACFGQSEVAKVYPNYEPVIRFALLAMDHQINAMGILTQMRAGMSREFHQLRDYHEGDTLSQVDWKATARRLQVISREYREQRDQSIIFMLDCGRRLRAMDGEFTQFDHCLNALLLLSYVALRQGDQVGVLGFGNGSTWFPPVKGIQGMPQLLDHLYDSHTEAVSSDFGEAVKQLMVRQKRRCMVVLMTKLRAEDDQGLEEALQQLRSKHLVTVASLREESVASLLNQPLSSHEEALTYGAAQLYQQDREALIQSLERHGVIVVDEPASCFPVSLVNHYLEMKLRGLL